MKPRLVILIGVGLLLAGAVAVLYLANRAVQSRIGPQHVYELSEQPKALNEELGLAKARETLTRDGLDIASWQEYDGTRLTGSELLIFTLRPNNCK